MKNRWRVVPVLALSAVTVGFFASAVSGCSGDDVSSDGSSDAGNIDATPFDGSVSDAAPSDGSTSDAGTGHPPWALFTINYSDQSDMAALSLDAGTFDGVLNYPSKYGATSIAADGPWVLAQATDLVQKLDPSAPWRGGSTWNVLGADDGGLPNANPYKVIAGPPGKDYVLRFNRNQIAMIDPTESGTNIAPKKFIDLSAFLDPSDEDGAVDMISGVYVAAQHRVYVLLANLDLYNVDAKAYFTLCGSTHSEIVAIDTNTDTVVSAADGGVAGTPIVFAGYDAVGLVDDVARNRLLVVESGCSDPSVTDGGPPGTTHMRQIDALDMATGAPSIALDLNGGDVPTAFAFTDAAHLVLRLEHYDYAFGATKVWDVTTSALGADVANAPDVFATDGQGHLIGVSTTYLADGGEAVTLLSVRVDDGGVTSFGAPPYRKKPAIVTAADFWQP